MSKRKIIFVNGEFYHIVNRSIAYQPIFENKSDCQRALGTFFYYQNQNLVFRYSYFSRQTKKEKEKIINELKLKKDFLVEIIAYCLMPNHFHFLLKQKINNGITKFIGNFTNSYSRYFNSKRKRSGPLFQNRFRAIRIETEQQLLHVSRYIHLNPYSAYMIKNMNELEIYPYSSLPEYIGKTNFGRCCKEGIFHYFKSKQKYRSFIFNQADYQRELQKIKHLVLEK